jgi:hypothetical protein
MNVLSLVCWLGLSVWLTACDIQKPKYPREQGVPLTVTISSDGQLVAVLDRTGTPEQRLRIKWVNQDAPWQELPLPVYTSNIHFALEGYDLLLSHRLPDNTDVGQITRWNVSDLSKDSQMIHQAPYLSSPIEVKPGMYMARTCEPNGMDMERRDRNSCQGYGGGTYWIWLEPGQEPVRVTPRELLPLFGQPNITDKGFFWPTDRVIGSGIFDIDTKSLRHPFLLTFPFPGGEAPQVAVEHLSKESFLRCDRLIERCIRKFLKGTDPITQKFIYDHEVIYQGQSCPFEGVQGYADVAVITPDGRVAVIPVARAFSEPRRVVILKFQDGQCEPASIQHLNF